MRAGAGAGGRAGGAARGRAAALAAAAAALGALAAGAGPRGAAAAAGAAAGAGGGMGGGGAAGARRAGERNVLGGPLELCGVAPLTGFFRDGYCCTGPQDAGRHVVCASVTAEFLEYTKARGNDLSSPAPAYGFPGLLPGGRWCLCASRWGEALRAGKAPKVRPGPPPPPLAPCARPPRPAPRLPPPPPPLAQGSRV